jgi:hypothetical protein
MVLWRAAPLLISYLKFNFMKKIVLKLVAMFVVTATMNAQESEIWYPTLNDGYTVVNVEGNADAIAKELWKGSGQCDMSNEELGFTKNLAGRALRVRAYDGSSSNYYRTDSYCILNPVDLSIYPQERDFKVTFCARCDYYEAAPGNHGQVFSVYLTTDYTGDPTTTDWDDVTEDVTPDFNPLDADGKWDKYTLDLEDYKGEENLVFAFRFFVENEGAIDSKTDRPGRWRVGEIRFTTGDYATAIGDGVEENTFSFSPNPAQEEIQIIGENVASLTIYDLNGQVVKTVENPANSINISSLSRGLYVVEVKGEGGNIETVKLIKK